MPQPLIPIQTVQYKTYIKQVLVNALRSMFENHPDPILANTKSTIDFPMTEVEYPAVVVRFYERSIKNAGVGHREYFPTGELVDQETWFDPFSEEYESTYRTDLDYKTVDGSYPSDGLLKTSSFSVIPWKPSQTIDGTTGQRSHARIHRLANEVVTIRLGLGASTDNTVSFVAEAVFGASNTVLNLIYIDSSGDETILETSTISSSGNGYKWISFHLEGDGTLRADLMNGDPLSASLSSLGNVSAEATSGQLATLTETNNQYSLSGSSTTDGTSRITLFRTLKTNVEDQRVFAYKQYFYDGDIELAIYALSSYDRDLISDTIVQVLGMGDVSTWASGFVETLSDPNSNPNIPANIAHTFTINTDVLQGFGETQQIAPWMPEDQMVYQTSYRFGIFGGFYSPTPESGSDGIGLVERIETYPYQFGEPVPNPPWSGPDHVQGTDDDVEVNDPWGSE